MRYISRDIQRQFARICLEARLSARDVDRVAEAILANNGTPATAFQQYIANNQPLGSPPPIDQGDNHA